MEQSLLPTNVAPSSVLVEPSPAVVASMNNHGTNNVTIAIASASTSAAAAQNLTTSAATSVLPIASQVIDPATTTAVTTDVVVDVPTAVASAAAPVVAAAAAVVTAEATARLFLQVLLSSQQQPQQQPLLDVLQRPVKVNPNHNDPDTLQSALQQFDALLIDCARIVDERNNEALALQDGIAPGFYTKSCTRRWDSPEQLPSYETLPSINNNGTLPVMSVAAARPVFLAMRQAIVERLRYLQDKQAGDIEASKAYCSCVSDWEAIPQNLGWVVNQALEQVRGIILRLEIFKK